MKSSVEARSLTSKECAESSGTNKFLTVYNMKNLKQYKKEKIKLD